MITIAKRVEELIQQWPMLKEGIELDLLNVSSVARYLKPEVEKEVGERISEAAVLMAIRRYQKRGGNLQAKKRPQDFLGDLSLRSNLHDITYANSPTLSKKLSEIAQRFSSQSYLTISRGLLQTSVILHTDGLPEVIEQLKDEHLEMRVDDLSAIALQIKRGYGQLPGILAFPLSLLAWRGIPIVEIVSTYDELNLILHKKDVENAFTALNRALQTKRDF